MQEIITRCDVCAELAEPVVVALGRTERRVVVDLCPAHDVELVGPLRELLAAHARPIVDAEPGTSSKPVALPADRPWQCLVCGQLSKTASGLKQHYRAKHGVGLSELVPDLRCPVCSSTLETPTGLGAHAAAHPGINPADGIVGLIRAATEAGDPHGVVAAMRRRASSAARAAA